VPVSNLKAQVSLLALSIGGVAFGLYGFFHRWKQRRWLEETPESRVRSAAQGYVRLTGRAEPLGLKALRSPLTGRPCVWWKYTVHSRDSAPNNWHGGQSETSTEPFVLTDEAHSCVIDPQGADVEPSERRAWSGDSTQSLSTWPLTFMRLGGSRNESHYVEEIILENAQLSVLGELRTTTSSLTHALEDEVAAKLVKWKADQAALLARFDANHDGKIDPDEWQQARAAARIEVEQERLKRPPEPSRNWLGKPSEGRPYLIAALSPEKLAAKDGRRAIAALALTLISLAAACYLLIDFSL
jgi:hypothetical protein